MAKRPRFSRNASDIACAARTGKTPTKIEAPPPVRPRGGSGLGGARFASRPRGPAVTPVARRPARGTKARAFRADIAVGRGGVLPQGRFRGVRHRDPGSRNSATATRHPTCPQKAASATPGVHLVRRPGDTPWDRCLLALRWSHVVFGHLPARVADPIASLPRDLVEERAVPGRPAVIGGRCRMRMDRLRTRQEDPSTKRRAFGVRRFGILEIYSVYH